MSDVERFQWIVMVFLVFIVVNQRVAVGQANATAKKAQLQAAELLRTNNNNADILNECVKVVNRHDEALKAHAAGITTITVLFAEMQKGRS